MLAIESYEAIYIEMDFTNLLLILIKSLSSR